MITIDIRQSDEWSEYLKLYGWQSHKLSGGDIFRTMKLGPLCFGKLLRPTFLNEPELAELDDISRRTKVTSTKISPNNAEITSLLTQAGFTRRGAIDLPPRTLLINLLLSQADLLKSFSQNCRRCIKKSTQNKDTVEIIQNPKRAQIEDYYKIVRERGSKRGFYVQGLTDHIRKVEVFKEKSYLVNSYSQEHEILGTRLFLGFGDAVWYMHGGITPKGKHSKVGYLSMWEAFNYLKQLGYKVLDFESLADDRLKSFTKSWRGYTEFKLKFGGETFDYPLPWSKYYRFLTPLNSF